jgi:hypothetical protein
MTAKDCIISQHPDIGPDIHRSYHRDVTRFLDNLGMGQFSYTQIFGITSPNHGDHALYYVRLGSGPKHILVTGGVHGEEPAGTYAALDLISYFANHRMYDKDFTVHIYPCLNPWGYEHDTRENAEGMDINRGFKEKIEVAECRMFADNLKKVGIKEYEFTIDFHEGSRNQIWKNFTIDDNPDGAWLYELCHNHDKRMGRQMIEAVRQSVSPVNTLKKVYDDICHDGLVSYPEDMESEDYSELNSLDAFLWRNYTQDAFTSETNEDWPMEDRIEAHHTFFFTALNTIGPPQNQNDPRC